MKNKLSKYPGLQLTGLYLVNRHTVTKIKIVAIQTNFSYESWMRLIKFMETCNIY
jgi:hypothetical protein